MKAPVAEWCNHDWNNLHTQQAYRLVSLSPAAASQRRVQRLMRLAGLEGCCKKRYRKSTTPDPVADLAWDLIQRAFGPCEEIKRRYVCDVTDISTWQGWTHLATVFDLASRRVVGWAFAEAALSSTFINRDHPSPSFFTRIGVRFSHG